MIEAEKRSFEFTARQLSALGGFCLCVVRVEQPERDRRVLRADDPGRMRAVGAVLYVEHGPGCIWEMERWADGSYSACMASKAAPLSPP